MVITSLNNGYIKEINKLKEKKYRDITNKFLIEGEHLVNEAIKKGLVYELVVLEGIDLAFDNIHITYVSKDVMKKLSSMDSYSNVIGICHKQKEEDIKGNILILDDIQDPGNLGTIIRSSVAFNIDTIILSPKTVDLYNSKVIRSTQGMMFHINIINRKLDEVIHELKEKEIPIYGTKVEYGEDVRSFPSKDKKAYGLVMGNEGAGVSSEVLDMCDKYIYIDMNERVESLNVSIATSIILYELNR